MDSTPESSGRRGFTNGDVLNTPVPEEGQAVYDEASAGRERLEPCPELVE